jgi:hypothetical protein
MIASFRFGVPGSRRQTHTTRCAVVYQLLLVGIDRGH